MSHTAPDPNLRILKPLGRGGTANVVKAYHAGLKKEVAVKQWRPDSDTTQADFIRLIERERELIGACRFPGLVRVLDDPEPDRARLLLEYCPGPTLDSVDRPSDTVTALNIISAIALDLEYLRITGLVHGDLKPQNVFLPPDLTELRRGRLSFVKLSDFSLGRHLQETPDCRLGVGTIGYMAPETIADGRMTLCSDLFALGIIAYQLLCGEHPFLTQNTEPVKVNCRIREQDPVAPAKLRPDLPAEVVAVVSRLLAKEESARFASGWETCVELEKAGATYPFREAWRPAFLFQARQRYVEYLEACLGMQDCEAARLDELTGQDVGKLRLVLTANFLRRQLVYDGRAFRFSGTIYWPHRLRSNLLKRFGSASFAERRAAVLAASIGGRNAVARLDLGGAGDAGGPLEALLLPLLKVDTIKRLATRYAPIADRLSRHDLAAELHLRAGNMDEAERCTDLAAREWNRTNQNDVALALLRKLHLGARTAGKEFEIRRSLLLKGNLHKENGELDLAESTYHRIVELYRERPADKLLAETYKNIGESLRLRQDSQAALAALQKSLDVFRELRDELEISHTLVNMGNVHWIANETRQAITSYRAAYKIQKELQAGADLASTLHNIASIYCLDGRIKRGIFLLEHALRLKKEIGHQGEIARTLNNLGYACQISGNPVKAVDYITESLEINRRIGSRKEVLHNLENLVSLQIAAGRLKEALDLLREGQSLATEHGLIAHAAPCHLHTATIAKRMGSYGEATRSLAKVDDLLPDIDDYSLDLLAAVQKAGLRYHLGDNPTALRLVEEVYARAAASSNSVPELDSLLLAVRLTGNELYWERGNAIVDERRLVREKRLLTFGRIEYLLDSDEIDAASELAWGVMSQLGEIQQDLELAWMQSLAARICLEQNRESDARRHLSRALTAAQTSGLLPELITIQVLHAKLAKTRGDFEESFAALKSALETGRTVAASIAGDADRQLYQKKPVMQFLAAEISTLSRHLGQKQQEHQKQRAGD